MPFEQIHAYIVTNTPVSGHEIMRGMFDARVQCGKESSIAEPFITGNFSISSAFTGLHTQK
jgi:hypothetical protein